MDLNLSSLHAWLWTVVGGSIVVFTGLYWDELYPELTRIAEFMGMDEILKSIQKEQVRLAYGALGCIMTVSGLLCLFGNN